MKGNRVFSRQIDKQEIQIFHNRYEKIAQTHFSLINWRAFLWLQNYRNSFKLLRNLWQKNETKNACRNLEQQKKAQQPLNTPSYVHFKLNSFPAMAQANRVFQVSYFIKKQKKSLNKRGSWYEAIATEHSKLEIPLEGCRIAQLWSWNWKISLFF